MIKQLVLFLNKFRKSSLRAQSLQARMFLSVSYKNVVGADDDDGHSSSTKAVKPPPRRG